MNMLFYLPMMAGSGAMMLMFYVQPGQNRDLLHLSGGDDGRRDPGDGCGLGDEGRTERKGRLKGERRDYLRYLGQIRKQIRSQRGPAALLHLFTHPDPARLWAMVSTDRLWERRANHADFAEVRIGLGQQRLALKLQAPQTKPVEDLEPLCASALRRLFGLHGIERCRWRSTCVASPGSVSTVR